MRVQKIVESIFRDIAPDLLERVYLFGSRVSHTHRENSDLDVFVDDDLNNPVDPHIVSMLEEAFERSDLLFKVDLVFKSRITEEFFQGIKPGLRRLM